MTHVQNLLLVIYMYSRAIHARKILSVFSFGMEVKAPGTQSVKEREMLYRLIVG